MCHNLASHIPSRGFISWLSQGNLLVHGDWDLSNRESESRVLERRQISCVIGPRPPERFFSSSPALMPIRPCEALASICGKASEVGKVGQNLHDKGGGPGGWVGSPPTGNTGPAALAFDRVVRVRGAILAMPVFPVLLQRPFSSALFVKLGGGHSTALHPVDMRMCASPPPRHLEEDPKRGVIAGS